MSSSVDFQNVLGARSGFRPVTLSEKLRAAAFGEGANLDEARATFAQLASILTALDETVRENPLAETIRQSVAYTEGVSAKDVILGVGPLGATAWVREGASTPTKSGRKTRGGWGAPKVGELRERADNLNVRSEFDGLFATCRDVATKTLASQWLDAKEREDVATAASIAAQVRGEDVQVVPASAETVNVDEIQNDDDLGESDLDSLYSAE